METFGKKQFGQWEGMSMKTLLYVQIHEHDYKNTNTTDGCVSEWECERVFAIMNTIQFVCHAGFIGDINYAVESLFIIPMGRQWLSGCGFVCVRASERRFHVSFEYRRFHSSVNGII